MAAALLVLIPSTRANVDGLICHLRLVTMDVNKSELVTGDGLQQNLGEILSAIALKARHDIKKLSPSLQCL